MKLFIEPMKFIVSVEKSIHYFAQMYPYLRIISDEINFQIGLCYTKPH
jgi:hypothetical protein